MPLTSFHRTVPSEIESVTFGYLETSRIRRLSILGFTLVTQPCSCAFFRYIFPNHFSSFVHGSKLVVSLLNRQNICPPCEFRQNTLPPPVKKAARSP
eukprot:g44299.t1